MISKLNLPKSSKIPADVSGYPNFDTYQRKVLNNLGYFALSLQHIGQEGNGSNFITSSPILAQILFYFTCTNTLVKVIYISYLLHAKFDQFEFLDKMGTSLYLLVFGIMTISYSIWFKRYPLYEIMHRLWTIETDIFQRLGQPPNLKEEVDARHKATVWIHLGITWIGCCCFMVQYYAAPKYATFTYAFFDAENWFLFTLFGLHEFLFMLHAWNLMTGSNCLFTFQAIALYNVINEMSKQIEFLSLSLAIQRNNSDAHSRRKRKEFLVNAVGGNGYPIDDVIFDYKQLMLLTERYNEWTSYKTVFLHICGYCQFISDVFLAVQVLRLPGTGIFDIWFYIEDSLASMYMIYRVYEFMSRVEPASTEFFRTLKKYLGQPLVCAQDRKRLLKTLKTLKLVSINIGPCPVTRSTVLSAMEILGNYYICVALW